MSEVETPVETPKAQETLPSEKPAEAEKAGSVAKSAQIIRTKDQGCFRVCSSRAWGRYLIPTEDPEGQELTRFELAGIQLNKEFSRIPGDLWARYIGLCFYMCPAGQKLTKSHHDSQLEVQVCLLRDRDTLTKWKIVVPKQVVSGVSVKAELNENIDIVTGEKFTQFPPPGWLHAGSSHSHNTMEAFFSGTDDKSELNVPGLHIVIGTIDHEKMQYTFKASVVLQKLRKEVELEAVVDGTPMECEFHPDVLDYIDTVVSANRKMYSKLFEKKENERSKSGESETGNGNSEKMSLQDLEDFREMSDVPFFDESGKPTSFLLGLDRTNSDVFDDPENSPWFNEDVALSVDEWLEDGIHPEIIRRSMEAVFGGWNNVQESSEQED